MLKKSSFLNKIQRLVFASLSSTVSLINRGLAIKKSSFLKVNSAVGFRFPFSFLYSFVDQS